MQKIIAQIKAEKIVGIIRLELGDKTIPVFEAMYEGSLNTIEITLTTPGALVSIAEISNRNDMNFCIGAGSVVDAETVSKCVDAGAQYIVTPEINGSVIEAVHKLNMPLLAGALTPTEILKAYQLGCQLIKVFPAEFFGTKYIKAIKAPMPYVALVPTGGVNLENINHWFAVGASAVGVSSAFFKGFDIRKPNYPVITNNSRKLKSALE